MIKSIKHVGILVNNLDEAVSLYCDLFGLKKPLQVTEWPGEGMKNVLIEVGDQAFEIMEPLPGSFLKKFIEQRGEGIHHVSLDVSDMESLIKSLKDKGAALIERDARTAFLHPKSAKGVLFELREYSP